MNYQENEQRGEQGSSQQNQNWDPQNKRTEGMEDGRSQNEQEQGGSLNDEEENLNAGVTDQYDQDETGGRQYDSEERQQNDQDDWNENRENTEERDEDERDSSLI
jgi:hypothetical protein